MDADQLCFGQSGIALILAIFGPAVGQKMLGGCRDLDRTERLAGQQVAL